MKRGNCRRRWGVKQLAIPKKDKTPYPNSNKPWFKNAMKQRITIEPVIGHLKSDHQMNRCHYKGAKGDTVNVVWTTLAWNTKKITRLGRKAGTKRDETPHNRKTEHGFPFPL